MARKVKPETRAKRLIEGVPQCRYDQAYQIALNVVFMEDKLDQARDFIGETSVAIPYDNGGGQTGIRENPAYKGYHSLLKSYMSAIDEIEKLMNDGDKSEKDKKKVTLAEQRAKFRANVTVSSQKTA